MSKEDFSCSYEVDDGYAGPSRPLHVKISQDDIDDDMDEVELDMLYDKCIQDHYEANVYPNGRNREAFHVWVKGVLQERAAEEEE